MISLGHAEQIRSESYQKGFVAGESGWIVTTLRKQLEEVKAERDALKVSLSELEQEFITHVSKNEPHSCDQWHCGQTGPMKALFTPEGRLGGFVCAGECAPMPDGCP